MVADSVSEVLRLALSSVEPAPETISTKIKADYLKGVGKLDDRLLILLDLERMSDLAINITEITEKIEDVKSLTNIPKMGENCR